MSYISSSQNNSNTLNFANSFITGFQDAKFCTTNKIHLAAVLRKSAKGFFFFKEADKHRFIFRKVSVAAHIMLCKYLLNEISSSPELNDK